MIVIQRIKHQKDIKVNNKELLFTLIKNNDCVSRSWLARKAKLSPSTVSLLVDELIAKDLVSELQAYDSSTVTLGRRPIGLSVNVHNHFILGISIKEHSLSGGVYNLRLEEIFFTESEKLDLSTDPMKYLIDFIQKLMDSYPNKTFCAIGVALPAIIDERRERVLTSLGITMFGEDIKSALEEHFGIPVMLDNEGRAAGLAEKSTYYPEVNGFVYFSLIDKGLGGFVTSRYDLSRPSVGVSAEIGHMSVDVHGKRCRCGNHGCLEALASIEAMVTSYAAALNVPEDSVSYHDLVMAFLGNRPEAVAVVKKAADYMAAGVVNVGVGDNHIVDIARRKVQGVVVVLIPSLLKAAVYQDLFFIYLQAVAAAGDCVGCTEKG